jgi:hypothetical protein
MDALIQQVLQQVSGTGISQISKKLGVNEQTVNSALSVALPLLLSALTNNASQPKGAQSLHQALTKDHDGSILNNVSGFLENPQAANGAGILGHMLGSQQPVVTQRLTQGTGLNGDQISQLLQIAAPLVMGALGQQQRQAGFDPNGLSSFLGGQQQMAQQSNPDLMGVLNGLLDTNQDGSAVDDIIGGLGKLFGGQ